MIILKTNLFFKNTGILGITLFPFIFIYKDKYNKYKDWYVQCYDDNHLEVGVSTYDQIIINHEKIHWYQQLELLIVPFYIWYVLNWLYNGIIKYKGKNWDLAYRDIIFEKEAYDNEYNLSYLESRKIWSFRKYLR